MNQNAVILTAEEALNVMALIFDHLQEEWDKSQLDTFGDPVHLLLEDVAIRIQKTLSP